MTTTRSVVAAVAALPLSAAVASAGVSFGTPGVFTGTVDSFEMSVSAFAEAREGVSTTDSFDDFSNAIDGTLQGDAFASRFGGGLNGPAFGGESSGIAHSLFNDGSADPNSGGFLGGLLRADAYTRTFEGFGDASAVVSVSMSYSFTIDVITGGTIDVFFDVGGFVQLNGLGGSADAFLSFDGPGVSEFPGVNPGETIDSNQVIAIGDGEYLFSIDISINLGELQGGDDSHAFSSIFAAVSFDTTDPAVDRPSDLGEGEIIVEPPLLDPNAFPTPGTTTLLAMGALAAMRRRR